MERNVREWTSENGNKDNLHIIRGASWRDAGSKHFQWDDEVAGAIWGKDNRIGFSVVITKENNSNKND